MPQGAGLGAAATAATAPASAADGAWPPAEGAAVGTAAPFSPGCALPAAGAVRSLLLLLGPPGRCGEFWTATRPMLSRCATSGLPNQPSTCSYSRECLPCMSNRANVPLPVYSCLCVLSIPASKCSCLQGKTACIT
jgi:hypothetical protein